MPLWTEAPLYSDEPDGQPAENGEHQNHPSAAILGRVQNSKLIISPHVAAFSDLWKIVGDETGLHQLDRASLARLAATVTQMSGYVAPPCLTAGYVPTWIRQASSPTRAPVQAWGASPHPRPLHAPCNNGSLAAARRWARSALLHHGRLQTPLGTRRATGSLP